MMVSPMNTTVIQCPHLFQRLGAVRRVERPGPESALVDWFIAEKPFQVPRGCRATIFREPRLSSGYPDFVLVFWSERAIASWSKARPQLTDSDVRVMQYLVQHGDSTLLELENVFAFEAEQRIDRLAAAGMLTRRAGTWRARSLSHCFAVRKIVAFEAKVKDWTIALEQAFLNTWFASESYVLLPHVPRGEKLIQAASNLGLGVWTRKDGCRLEPRSSSAKLPISYASWLFNEWVWRAETQFTAID